MELLHADTIIRLKFDFKDFLIPLGIVEDYISMSSQIICVLKTSKNISLKSLSSWINIE